MRVTARRPSTYSLRYAAAVSAVLGLLILGFGQLAGIAANPGAFMVRGMVAVAFLTGVSLSLLAGADALSSEKRQGTLGLLFLARLNSLEIVLQQLAAHFATICFGLLAAVPILALCVLVGGVNAGEFLRMVLFLAHSVLFALTLGLFVSACSRRQRAAQAGALSLLLFFLAGLPAAGSLLSGGIGSIPAAFSLFSPVFVFFDAMESRYAVAPSRFWGGLLIQQLAAWILVGASCVVLSRTWRDNPDQFAVPERKRLRRSQRVRPREKMLQLLNRSPFEWLAVTRSRAQWGLGAAVVLVGSVGMAGATVSAGMKTRELFFLAAWFALHGAAKLWAASEAGYRFGADRQTGRLELLLATGLQVNELVHSQKQALRTVLALPLFLVISFDAALMSIGELSWFIPRPLFYAVMVSSLLIDVHTLAVVGMWTGLSSNHPVRAVFRAAWLVMIRPAAICLGLVALFGIRRTAMVELLLIWWTVGVLNNLFCWRSAVRGLKDDFWALATNQPLAPAPHAAGAIPRIREGF